MESIGADERTVLYRYFGEAGDLLYIGITDEPGRRWKEHMKSQPWWASVRRQTAQWYDTRASAEVAEISAIRSERPLHNVRHARAEPQEMYLANPRVCPACGSSTVTPVGYMEHLELELRRLPGSGHAPETIERLSRELGRMRVALDRFAKAVDEAEAALKQSQLRPQRTRATPEPPTSDEVVQLLEDLDHVLGEERVRIADLPAMLRQFRPDDPLYRGLTGIRLATALRSRGIRITNSGNVPRLHPADLRSARPFAA